MTVDDERCKARYTAQLPLSSADEIWIDVTFTCCVHGSRQIADSSENRQVAFHSDPGTNQSPVPFHCRNANYKINRFL